DHEESIVPGIDRCRNWLSLIVLMFGTSGCGSDPYGNFVSVTGTLMCNGKPAEGATVVFSPDDEPEKTRRSTGNPGPSSRGVVQEDGTFSLITFNYMGRMEIAGALVGPHTVSVEPPRTKSPELTALQAAMEPEARAEIEAKLKALPLFKPLDCGVQVTPVSVEVSATGADNDFDLNLEGSVAKAKIAPESKRRGPGAGLAPPRTKKSK
ncbi:MAG: hypothetical protein ACT4QC_24255, partial [Planctomycetaceae bacterium]